jgi:hypothetical protein
MPREVHFYECAICEAQHESWSIAAECEYGHEWGKEATE